MRKLVLIFAVAGCGANYVYSEDLSTPDLAMVEPDLAAPKNPAMCDPVAQNCVEPTANKCVFTPATMQGDSDTETCVATKGTNMEGQPCTRAAFGDDDCAAGLVCTLRGLPDGQFVCRKFCHDTSDCPSQQTCTNISNQTTNIGLCTPTCAAFGSDCTGNTTCTAFVRVVSASDMGRAVVFTCRPIGTVPAGGSCMAETDCVANTSCLGQGASGMCTPLCDDNHACPGAPADAGAADDAGAGPTCMVSFGGSVGFCR